jgi:hypothetical protein
MVIQTSGFGVSAIECGCGLVLLRHYWKDWVGGRKAQPIIDTKNSAMSTNTSIAIIYNNDAEGGTRTRTAFWARGFSYHYSFRYPPLFSGLTVCGLDDAFSMHVSFYACLI